MLKMTTARRRYAMRAWPVLLSVLMLSAPVLAEGISPPPGSTPVPDGAPTLKGGNIPEITIRTEGKTKIEEFRYHGALYMVKVYPPHGKPYYLIDLNGQGQFTRFDGPIPRVLVPQWVIGRF